MCFHDINDARILQLTVDSHFTSVVWLLGVCACLMITSVVWLLGVCASSMILTSRFRLDH